MGVLLEKLKNISPDISLTLKRFPLPIFLLAITTILTIGLTNDLISSKNDFWPLMALGFAIAAIFATAGRLFSESGKGNLLTIIILEIIIPAAVIAAMQIKVFTLFVPFFLPLIGIFWLSVAPFTEIGKGAKCQEIQDRFWIVNHRAVVSGMIAGVGFSLIALGIFAIERALSLLFGLDVKNIFYEYILPFAGIFLVPLYWLSTIDNLDEVNAKELENPDFLSKAIGFLGQFLFVPFLIAYALILLAYAAQIVITQTLPVGTLGWMVLGFTITGAVAWLLVYPAFMQKKIMVRLFHKVWFWLTIVPLILFVIGVYIRIEAYGFTSERMFLIAGGLWAGLLTIFFLSRKFTDIRLMPILAGVIFVILSIGPFNISNLPIINQASRLKAAIISAIPDSQSMFSNPNWSEENAKKALGALDYLYKEDEGEILLEQVLTRFGIGYDSDTILLDIKRNLELNDYEYNDRKEKFKIVSVAENTYADLSATPFYLGNARIDKYSSTGVSVGSLTFVIMAQAIKISDGQGRETNIEVSDWLAKQRGEILANPEIDFIINNIKYRLQVDFVSLEKNSDNEWQIQRLEGLLFSSEIPLAN